MQENNSIINLNWQLYENFYIEDIVSVYPNPDYFNEPDCPPWTFTAPDCYEDSYSSSIASDACENLDNKDIQVELECQGRTLTIRVIYPNRDKENLHLDLLF
ncbi:hypothetical protein LGL55_13880 [Clostridium tagluense]|uniref:hypothetical protein n=1 Tax=Clostridium tagluense TaxID=360422 RepID=UPI001CF30A37|nr:hypothetical protein [Clostridium tagluense]MCB2312379.1 hypothetical protein [Clostridium tagluense]MCB2317054.1 hypothetical protein [Clostridium tagluense]MCB2321919.1 hypothetical protein [Clostridium tagluense]MCB2326834.1 hypothetical protein [Clostridium tagluense]MCB2331646.1 hypothetical protein [Clostridium tagluense]